MLMLTAPEVVQRAVNDMNADLQRNLREGMERITAIYGAYEKLKEAGVAGLPENLTMWTVRWGFNVEVKEPKEWGKIHKALGKLELTDKRPVETSTEKRGRKVQKVKLVLSPDVKYLRHNVQFTVERKLTKSDKCKVRVVKNKSVEVVCSLK